MIICSCHILSDSMVLDWLTTKPGFCWAVTEMYRCRGCKPKRVRTICEIIEIETGDSRPDWARATQAPRCPSPAMPFRGQDQPACESRASAALECKA